MHATMTKIMKRSTALTGCALLLWLGGVADASAHGVEIRPAYVQVHYVHGRDVTFPGWLMRNRKFQRWYWNSQYRFRRHTSWERVYNLYLVDKRLYRPDRRSYHRHRHP